MISLFIGFITFHSSSELLMSADRLTRFLKLTWMISFLLFPRIIPQKNQIYALTLNECLKICFNIFWCSSSRHFLSFSSSKPLYKRKLYTRGSSLKTKFFMSSLLMPSFFVMYPFRSSSHVSFWSPLPNGFPLMKCLRASFIAL